jgi:hypothetical protein
MSYASVYNRNEDVLDLCRLHLQFCLFLTGHHGRQGTIYELPKSDVESDDRPKVELTKYMPEKLSTSCGITKCNDCISITWLLGELHECEINRSGFKTCTDRTIRRQVVL